MRTAGGSAGAGASVGMAGVTFLAHASGRSPFALQMGSGFPYSLSMQEDVSCPGRADWLADLTALASVHSMLYSTALKADSSAL